MKRAEMRVRTRQGIIDGAVELFGGHRHEDITLDDIVARVGLTKGAFYHHFSGKEELRSLVEHAALDELIDKTATVADERLPPPQELARLLGFHFDVLMHYRGSLLLPRPNSIEDRRAMRAKRDRIGQSIVDVVERGVQSGDFEFEGDARLVAYGIIGIFYYANVWFHDDGQWSVDDVREVFTKLALRALRRDKPTP